MRIFKIACIVLFLSLAPQTGYCQIGKGISQIAKSLLKKGGKEAGEEAVEKGAKSAAKKAGKSAAKKSAKEIAGESAELAIRRNASNSLSRKGASKTIKMDKVAVDNAEMAKYLKGSIGKGAIKGARGVVSKEAGAKVSTEAIELTDRELVKKYGTSQSRKVVEQSGKRGLKSGSEKAAKKKAAVRAGKTLTGREALKLLDNYPTLRNTVMEMECKYGPNFALDRLVVGKSGKHMVVEFPGTASRIEVKGNTIFAKGGSLPSKGEMNAFLNEPLPNSTYIVDGYTKYVTDAFGKTIEVECHSSALAKSVKRTNLAQENQAALVEAKGGKRGVHDAGHIQQRSTGGNNESINLLPMKSSKQRGGKWAKMEKTERDAIDAGKDVVTKKKIKYNPDGSFTLDVEMKIKDPVSGKASTKNWSHSDLF